MVNKTETKPPKLQPVFFTSLNLGMSPSPAGTKKARKAGFPGKFVGPPFF
jgi:hypothetical protein